MHARHVIVRTVKCPSCGTANPDGARFCNACGTHLDPTAREAGPQRAVWAGLDIFSGITAYKEQLRVERGLDLDVRVGIHTGPVMVGQVGSDLRLEYTAMGDAVNVAARMEQTADPGT